MRIAAASDVHGLWCGLDYPEADLLVFAGDIFGYHDIDPLRNAYVQLKELKMFNEYLGIIKDRYKEILCISGNHDFVFRHYLDEARSILTNATYLQDESTAFQGYRIYGSPWQPYMGGWAFNFPDEKANFFRARAYAKKCWNAIPEDTDILITHSPAKNILDTTAKGVEVGCSYLKERIFNLKELSLHIFGHIHASRGWKYINHRPLQPKGVLHVNAANCYSHKELAHPITLIDLKEKPVVI